MPTIGGTLAKGPMQAPPMKEELTGTPQWSKVGMARHRKGVLSAIISTSTSQPLADENVGEKRWSVSNLGEKVGLN